MSADQGRLIIAMGMGKSSQSAQAAAQNAIEQALQHSTWTILEARDISADQVRYRVSLGVGAPEAVEASALALPFDAEIVLQAGGLTVAPRGAGAVQHVATAAIEVFLPLQH